MNKLDNFFMILAKVLGFILILAILHFFGIFDGIIGREMMYRDYYHKHTNR